MTVNRLRKISWLIMLGLSLLASPSAVHANQTMSSAIQTSELERSSVPRESHPSATSQASLTQRIKQPAQSATNKTATTKILADQSVQPKERPSSDPVIFLGLWLTSGFNLQPTEEGYIPIRHSSSLVANGHRSWLAWLLNIFASPKYTWYASHDGKTWRQVGTNNKELSIYEYQTGTVYYQLNIQWSTLLNPFSTSIWSKVATVHWVPEPKSATELTVKADYPYLMNNIADDPDSTLVRAFPSPKDATPASISWTSDNPDIATVDRQTGEVTAVNGAQGVATIRCLWTNYDNSQLTGSTTIEVGGGLHDQTVEEGQPATFKILGNTNGSSTAAGMTFKIVWHQRSQTGRDRIVAQGNDLISYTTPATTMDDDKSHFYAVITVTAQGKSKTVTTNQALLTVLPGVHLALDNTLYNETAPDQHNATNTELNDVQPGDHLRYHDVIKNQSSGGSPQTIRYQTYLQRGDTVKRVQVGKRTLAPADFTLIDDGRRQVLTVPDINLAPGEDTPVVIESVVGQEGRSSTPFTFQPTLQTGERDFKGQSATINYAPEDLVRILPANIDYGRQANLVSGILYRRTESTNAPAPVLIVTDSRHQRTPLTITLAQNSDFVNQEQVKIPALRFRYYQGRHFIPLTPNRSITVAESAPGEQLRSVVWQPNQGLLLTANQHNLPAGDFHTTLTWTVRSGY